MALEPYLRRELVFSLPGSGAASASSGASAPALTRDDLFTHFARAACASLPDQSEADLHRRLMERERQMPTSTPEGIAFPHAVADHIEQTVLLAARASGGVDFGVANHPRADLIFCMFGCSTSPWQHVRLLARLARIVHDPACRADLRASTSPAQLHERLLAADRLHDA
jgi:mannitol/fructose-specific phosphotransferase system IIA component (Ntr-type)